MPAIAAADPSLSLAELPATIKLVASTLDPASMYIAEPYVPLLVEAELPMNDTFSSTTLEPLRTSMPTP